VVSVREDAELRTELVARFERGSGLRSVGVTDLISLRQAFYRTVVPPVPISPERQARLDQGRALHRILGSRLASEGILEARVRRDGLVGRIDILADLPVEVKTTSVLLEPSELLEYRADHIEQLGMYCGLVGRPVGRLLTVAAGPTGAVKVQAIDVAFRSTPRILSEMRRRADLLRAAWVESRVDGLPRCPWYGRGCEFDEASVCACTGDEAPTSHPLTEETENLSPRDDVRERVRLALSEPAMPENVPTVGRFREVLYPRRAYFERTAPASLSEEFTPPSLEPDLYARLSESLESGPPGEVARVPPRSAEPEEEVVGFRGRPLLVRTSRAWARFRGDDVVRRTPQYVLELGFRCATTGTDSGLVVVGFERAETVRERIQVLEVSFRSLTPFSRMLRERGRLLREALGERTPAVLPACPEWMVADCPYRSECGCGASAVRTSR
jgi:hypothetical protein